MSGFHVSLSPAAHLAALLHLAQTRSCMLRARMPLDDGELATVLEQIRAFEIPEQNLRPIASPAQPGPDRLAVRGFAGKGLELSRLNAFWVRRPVPTAVGVDAASV